MSSRGRRAALLALAVALPAPAGAGGSAPSPPPRLTVAAAANLQGVLPRIAEGFAGKTGRNVAFVFAATGSLAQQIRAGAPVDLFLSADRSTVEGLAESGDADPATIRTYAIGSLVLALSGKAAFRPGSVAQISDPRVARIGLANPEIAPYGRAGRQACERLGIWEAVRDRMVIGENVKQVMIYCTRGEVDAAFVPLSLAREARCAHLPVAPGLYDEIAQALAVPAHAPDAAGGGAFARYLTSDPGARRILSEAGYALPGAGP